MKCPVAHIDIQSGVKKGGVAKTNLSGANVEGSIHPLQVIQRQLEIGNRSAVAFALGLLLHGLCRRGLGTEERSQIQQLRAELEFDIGNLLVERDCKTTVEVGLTNAAAKLIHLEISGRTGEVSCQIQWIIGEPLTVDETDRREAGNIEVELQVGVG